MPIWWNNLLGKRPATMDRIERPIFIVGCGRSGTTLLFQLLRRHPEVRPTTGYPDGEDHIGWNEHGDCVISGLGHSDREGGHTGYSYCLHMNEDDVNADITKRMHRYYAHEVLGEKRGVRVLNKCPHLSNKLRYVRAIFPDACFVHIIRDCAPVVRSWEKIMEVQPGLVLYWPDTEYPCFWVMPAPAGRPKKQLFRMEQRMFPGNGVDILAEYWTETNRNIPRQLQDKPGSLLTIKYEDLCARPMEVLGSIATFCGLGAFEFSPKDDYGRMVVDRRTSEAERKIQTIRVDTLDRVERVRHLFGYA